MRLAALLQALPPALAARASTPTATRPGGARHHARLARGRARRRVLRPARRGVDGHAYLTQAIGLGASAVFVERCRRRLDLRGAVAVVVPDTRRALAPVSVRFFGAPADELFLVGITGTNGKTSTTYLVESILGRGPAGASA